MIRKLAIFTLTFGLMTGCAGSNAPQRIPLKFRAALLKKNGEQIRIAKTEFYINPEPLNKKDFSKPSDKRMSTHFTTDLNGEADIQLEPGPYYVNAVFDMGSNGFAQWEDVPVEVKPDDKDLELSNEGVKINSPGK